MRGFLWFVIKFGRTIAVGLMFPVFLIRKSYAERVKEEHAVWYIIWGTVKADIFVTRAIKPCNESSLVIKFSAFAARTSVYACDYIFKLHDFICCYIHIMR